MPEDLGVGVEGFDFLTRDGGHQAVLDAQQNLGTDVEGGIYEQIKRVGNGSFRGVLDGHDPVIRLPPRNLIKDIREIRLR